MYDKNGRKVDIIFRGEFFNLCKVGGGMIRIAPSLKGLQWLLHASWHMTGRTHEDFSREMRNFFREQKLGYLFLSREDKIRHKLITVSDVICVQEVNYLMSGGEDGITAMQKLLRDWYLECNSVGD